MKQMQRQLQCWMECLNLYANGVMPASLELVAEATYPRSMSPTDILPPTALRHASSYAKGVKPASLGLSGTPDYPRFPIRHPSLLQRSYVDPRTISMPQSLSRVAIHITFSTKNRQRFLIDSNLRDTLHRELGGISNTLDCQSIRVGGIEDHVHLLAYQSRTITLAEWIKELKRVSSIWIKEQSLELSAFQWQSGYGAFSVSHSAIDDVVRYIENQVEHHRKFDYKTEFLTLLQKHKIEYDERYLWD